LLAKHEKQYIFVQSLHVNLQCLQTKILISVFFLNFLTLNQLNMLNYNVSMYNKCTLIVTIVLAYVIVFLMYTF